VTDAELVERARQGESAAFGALVDRHRTAVYRAALAALGSHADAEDAAQEAFLSAYRRLATFRGDASFKTWMLTIAWHQAINQRRSLTRWWRRTARPGMQDGRGDRVEGNLTEADEQASRDDSPEEALAGDRLRREIAQQIRRLPAKLRDALLLAQAGEYSYEEISEMLRAPVGTIKWRVSEARRLVKLRLHERGFA
jgi:RNA polymerase sigma-70 factor, ECF subfamily